MSRTGRRNLLPPAAPLCIIGAPPEVPWRGHRHGACGEPWVRYHLATQPEAGSDGKKKMEQPTVTSQTLMQAEFDDRYMPYGRRLVTLWLIVTGVGILVFPFWWLLSLWYCPEYMRRVSARLATNALEIRKGVFTRAEPTIPLNRITDVRLHDGPLMRRYNLRGLKVETAGQGAGPGASESNLIGVVDAVQFRDAILRQRQQVLGAEATTAAPKAPLPRT